MNIIDQSYFPYTGVDYGEIPLTIILYLYSRSNSDNLGFHPWNFSLCWPANTYQIISSEATKTEMQHIKGTKWGYRRATGMLWASLSILSAAWDRQCTTTKPSTTSVEGRANFHRERGMHKHNSRFPLMKWKSGGWIAKSGVRVRPTNPPPGTSGLEMPVQDLNRWKAPLLSLRGQINIIKRNVMPAF